MKCNLSKTLLSVFHITYYLYRLKISTFYSIQRRNSDKNANFFAWEKDRMMSVGSNFLCGCPHGADELISPRPHVSTRVWPLLPTHGRHKWMAPLTKKCISTKWNMILIDAFDKNRNGIPVRSISSFGSNDSGCWEKLNNNWQFQVRRHRNSTACFVGM